MAFRQKYAVELRSLAAVVLLSVCTPIPSALAQSQVPPQVSGCVLSPDKRSADDKILRCGTALTVRPAPGTVYHALDAGADRPPGSVQLDSGALLIEFHPTAKRRDFQILTPQAIAAVRGTSWAVEVKPGQSSVLVLTGAVRVARANNAGAVVLRPGQGVDVTDAGEPLQIKQWPSQRVQALLSRFGS
jgi:hypothetical protein